MAGFPRAAILVAAFALVAAQCVLGQQEGRDCGKEGQACCCQATDYQAPRCCATGLRCTMFGGRGFGTPANISSLCLPQTPKACGSEGARCCLGQDLNGFVAGTCSSGLSCIPGSVVFGSKAQFERLSKGVAAAAADAGVAGTCKKAAACNTANNPCGKKAGCGSAACPSGFYCASSVDSGVGDVCLPLPANAGTAGGPCLPNNLPDAPTVESSFFGRKVAAPFCRGSAVCFTSVGGDLTGFNFGASGEATRIKGTRCQEVPKDCGSLGKPCCPSTLNMITDKPLPSGSWGLDACNPKLAEHGTFCNGSYAVLGGQPMGVCAANIACGGPNQPCCKYSKSSMAGLSCPRLGGIGAGYCNIAGWCKLCPKVAYLLEDLIRCY